MRPPRLLPIFIVFFIPLFCGEVFAACIDDGSGNFTCNVASGQDTESGNLTGQSLIKTGAGEIILTGNNAISNFVNINGGILSISDNINLAGNYVLNMNSATFKTDGNISLSNNFNANTAADAMLNVNSGILTLSGALGGDGNFSKGGGGTLYITGSLQNGGVITVNGGILQGNSESLTKNIQNYSKVIFQQDVDGTFLAAIYGSGDVAKKGNGTLILAGQQHFTGDFNILEGALQATSVSLLGRDVNVSSGAFVIFDQQDGAGTYANIISGNGALVKRGLDALTLTGQNTYTGGTFIEDSYGLIIGSDSVLGTASSDITLNGGRLSVAYNNISTARNFNLLNPEENNTLLPNYITVDSGLTYTVNGIISGGSFVKSGFGTLILTSQNVHDKGTQVVQGILSVGNQNSLGAGFLAITDDGIFKPLNSMDLDLNVYLRDNGKFYINAGDTLNAFGLLTGTGALIKDGPGIMYVTGNNIYESGVSVLGGTLQGNTDSLVGDINVSSSAQLDFTQNFNGQYLGNITAESSSVITKSGRALLELTGNNSFDTFNINEGVVAALSYFSGGVNIASPAALIIAEDSSGVINNGGNLYFATSKDIDFEGSIISASGSVLSMEVSEGSIYKLSVKDNGSSSQGNIGISSGAKLNLIAQGTYVAPQTFELIGYEGNLNGTFDNVVVADSKRITAELDYNSSPGAIYLTLNRLLSDYSALPDLKTNQRSIANAVDKGSRIPSDDFDLILNAADALPVSARARALDQLGGLIYANITALNSFDMLKENAYLRFNNALPEGEVPDNIWLQLASKYTNTKENDYSGKLYGFSNGAVLGLDKYYSPDFRGGLVFSYTRHDFKHNNLEDIDGDEFQAGFYALLKLREVDLKSTITGGYRMSDAVRNLAFAGRHTKSRFKSFSLNFDIEASVLFADIFGIELRPFAGFTSYIESRNSFSESGGGEADLSFKGDNVFYGDINAGLSLRRSGRSFSYYADLGMKQNVKNPDMTLNIYGQDFTVKPVDLGTSFVVKSGAVKKFSDLISFYGGAGAEFSGNYADLSLNAGLRSYW